MNVNDKNDLGCVWGDGALVLFFSDLFFSLGKTTFVFPFACVRELAIYPQLLSNVVLSFLLPALV